jgi:prepilin-type N-terminal cleavage/methylation domain-containing protein
MFCVSRSRFVIGKKRKRGRRAGFSLIELLVVIAIIALLVTILSPTVNHVKFLARQTVCASNVHDLMVAQLSWLHDNSQEFIPYLDPSGAASRFDLRGGEAHWPDLMLNASYVSPDVFVCPLDWRDVNPAWPDRYKCSYGVNYYAWLKDIWPQQARNLPTPWSTPGLVRMTDIRQPSAKILMVDEDEFYSPMTGLWSAKGKGIWRHREVWGACYGFGDGHVVPITFEEMFRVPFDPAVIGWNEMGTLLGDVEHLGSLGSGLHEPWNHAGPIPAEQVPAWAPWIN